MQTASGRSEEETVAALENLVARGILVEQTTTAAGSVPAAYDFSHEKLRALAYEEMGLARRRLLHRRLAETLAKSICVYSVKLCVAFTYAPSIYAVGGFFTVLALLLLAPAVRQQWIKK